MYLTSCLVSFVFLFVLLRKQETRTPIYLFFFVWSLTLFTILLLQPFVQFEYVGTLSVDIFIASSLLAFGVGYQAFKFRSVGNVYLVNSVRASHLAKIIICIALVGIVANLGMFIDKFLIGGSAFSLESTRAETFQVVEGAKDTSILQGVSSKLLPFSLISVIALPFIKKRTQIRGTLLRSIRFLSIVNAVLFALMGFMVYGGRMNSAIVILAYWISSFFLSEKAPRNQNISSATFKKVVIGVVSAWPILWMATSFLEFREGGFNDIFVLLHKLMRMEPMDYVKTLIDENPSIGLLLLSSGYFTSPIPSLDYYMNMGDIPGPYFGGYNFPLVLRNIAKLPFYPQEFDWFLIREDVFWPFVGNGYLGNVWATLLRDLAVDFTLYGCVVFMVIFGAFVAVFFGRGQRRSLYAHVISVMLSIVLVFSPFTGMFSSLYISYGIVYVLLLWIYSRMLYR